MDPSSTPPVAGLPQLFLRAEALAMLAVAAWAYQAVHANWVLFAVLFLVPDVSMLGYLINPRVGAICYNLAHTTVIYGSIGSIGYATNHPLALQIGLIGLAHIGFDRLLGYGLKYPEAFGLTHLGRVGKAA